MVLYKVIGSVTHRVELPDNLARKMLESNSAYRLVDDEKKPEKVEESETEERGEIPQRRGRPKNGKRNA